MGQTIADYMATGGASPKKSLSSTDDYMQNAYKKPPTKMDRAVSKVSGKAKGMAGKVGGAAKNLAGKVGRAGAKLGKFAGKAGAIGLGVAGAAALAHEIGRRNGRRAKKEEEEF